MIIIITQLLVYNLATVPKSYAANVGVAPQSPFPALELNAAVASAPTKTKSH